MLFDDIYRDGYALAGYTIGFQTGNIGDAYLGKNRYRRSVTNQTLTRFETILRLQTAWVQVTS